MLMAIESARLGLLSKNRSGILGVPQVGNNGNVLEEMWEEMS